MYIMSEKAVGFDWLKKNTPTLRHSTGCAKFTGIHGVVVPKQTSQQKELKRIQIQALKAQKQIEMDAKKAQKQIDMAALKAQKQIDMAAKKTQKKDEMDAKKAQKTSK